MNDSWRIDVNKNAMGGTELMMTALYKHLGEEFLEEIQIIPSRVRDLDETKVRIYWAHDLPEDGEAENALGNERWKNFHKIVFVSHWQQQRYIEKYQIPWSHTAVLKNAITPINVDIDNKFKDLETINLIYHTTPHRGLNVLLPVFEKLCETHKNIHLNVYSSFGIYGWEERDKEYEVLFQYVKDHEHMTYNQNVPNDKMKEILKDQHIFAYPSIWQETSCISLMEAMSAGLVCVHPNYGALYETSGNWTYMYGYDESLNEHAGIFHAALNNALFMVKEMSEPSLVKLKGQKSYVDLFYNWEIRSREWGALIDSLRGLPRELSHKPELFSYQVG
jgi:glycosyltransferase involved in cell wall biosynthesis